MSLPLYRCYMGRGKLLTKDQFSNVLGFRRGSDREDIVAVEKTIMSSLVLGDPGKAPRFSFTVLAPDHPENFSPSNKAVILMYDADENEVENAEFSWWCSKVWLAQEKVKRGGFHQAVFGGKAIYDRDILKLHAWLQEQTTRHPEWDDATFSF